MRHILEIDPHYEHVSSPPSLTGGSDLLMAIAEMNDLSVRWCVSVRPRVSLLALRGSGKGLWEGVDAQEYVRRLRDEWDR